MKKVESIIEQGIFASRWIQIPIYLGLIVASGLYTYRFTLELVHLFQVTNTITEEMMMLSILTLVDITMVLNLLTMVIIGGYATFISRLNVDDHEDKPEWLDKIDAGTLKVKLAGSLVSVSGIHLLKTFVNISHTPLEQVKVQVIIHAVFVVTTIVLALTEHIMHKKHTTKPH